MPDMIDVDARGGCLCGAVRFEIEGPLREVENCHCSQCRKTHGHYGAYTSARLESLRFIGTRGLRWYRSSPQALRGFCGVCGASLFFRADGTGRIAVAAGCLEQPTGLRSSAHIYVADKSDYYTLEDSLPKHAQDLDSPVVGEPA